MKQILAADARRFSRILLVVALIGGTAATAQDCVEYPDYLHRLGTVATPGEAEGVAFAGDLLFVADGMAGLLICSLSTGQPEILTVLDTPGICHAVAVSGDHAFLADGPGGLQIADVSDPENPSLVAELPMPS